MVDLVPATAEDLAGITTAPTEDDGYDWSGLARAAGQGIFGLGDEVMALARMVGSDLTYTDLLEDERRRLREFKKAHPAQALTAEIVTSVLIPGGTAMKLLKGGKYLRSAIVGGTEAGLYGAGVTEGGLAERAKGAAITAPIGAVASPAIMKGMSVVGEKVLPTVTERAKRLIRREMDEAKITPEDYVPLESEAAGLARPRDPSATELPLGPGDVVGDIPALQGLGVAATKHPGERFRTQQLLQARKNAEREALNDDLRQLFKTYDVDADDAIVNMSQRLRETEPARYAAAYDAVPTLRLSTDLGEFYGREVDELTPFVTRSYKTAKRTIDDLVEGKVGGWTEADRLPAKISDFIDGDTVTMRSAHQIRKNMDDMAYPKSGDVDEQVLAYRARRRRFNDTLAEINPEFAAANQAHEIFQVQKNAVKLGQSFNRRSVEQIKADMNSFTPELREQAQIAYRSGILSAINNARKNTRSSLAKYIQDHDKLKAKLEATFPDRPSYNQFITRVDRLVRQRATHDWLFTGSPTQPKLAQEASVSGAGDLAAGLYFGPGYAGITGMRALLRRHADKIDRKTRAELNRMLFNNPEGARKMLYEILSSTPRPAGRLARGTAATMPLMPGLLME